MSEWTDSLPVVRPDMSSKERAAWALSHISHTLRPDRTELGLLHDVRFAAAYVRAWRKSLPKDLQDERIKRWLDLGFNPDPRATLRVAAIHVLRADEFPATPGRYLRVAEASLRLAGERLMGESDE